VSADDVLPRPAHDVELRHGYTLEQVNGLSVWPVMRDRWHQFADFDERLEVAWHAMIEHIYASAERPEVADVVRAGWQAIGQHADRDEQSRRGYSHNRDAPISTGFERYWHSASQPATGPEERVTDNLALAQIWARLRPDHRELLAALAEHEDYGKAAAALGKSRHAYATEVGRARRAFRELWHEGETPSRPWGADRRPVKPGSPKARVTYRLIVRRRAALARSRARDADGQQRSSGAALEEQERS
jgi:hypothetical protein